MSGADPSAMSLGVETDCLPYPPSQIVLPPGGIGVAGYSMLVGVVEVDPVQSSANRFSGTGLARAT